jgi:Ca2+-binding RTX toxin-like protein
MPVQIVDTNAQIGYSAINQTWFIGPNVNAGGGVSSTFSGSVLVNYGNIMRADTWGAVFFNPDVLVYNKAGALIAGASGLSMAADQAEVHNEGNIFGFSGAGIQASNAANHVTITNSGSISGREAGISINPNSALVVSITNSGVISSDGNGIQVRFAVGAQPSIVNTGTIEGALNAILAEAGDRLGVTNTGSLIGNVRGTSTNQPDMVTNNGMIAGNVFLGTGSDVYKGTGSVSGYVNGEGGNDTLTGGSFADRLNGGSGVDLLTGNAGNDVLIGAAGNDTLAGGTGKDVMAGGANADSFVFNTAPNTSTNRDVINDFVAADDTLRFENAVFAKLGNAGVLNAQFLRLGAAPLDANDYLIYNKATGVLTYDVNGNAAGGAQQVAVLTTKPTLTLSDFVVI